MAVTRWADAPGTSNVVGRVPPSVHRFAKADLEQLVALRPDLVVVSEYTDADFLKQLERSGLRVHRMLGLGSLAGVRGAILDLGRAVGEDAAAGRLVAEYDGTLAELARRLAGATKPRVLYWSGNMTAGADTAIGALIEAAGAVNVGREMGITGIAPPGAERAFVTNPDVVLVGTWPGSTEAVTSHPLFSQWAAVREGRIVAMRTELLVALSPVHGRRRLGARAPAPSRSRPGVAWRAAVTRPPLAPRHPGPGRRARPRAAAGDRRGQRAAAVRAASWERSLAKLGLPGDASALGATGETILFTRAPAARAARRARRRRPRRGGRGAAGRLPQPARRLGPARRRRGGGARRGASPCTSGSRAPSSSRCRSPPSPARSPRCWPSTSSPARRGAPASTGLLLTGIAVSALAGADDVGAARGDRGVPREDGAVLARGRPRRPRLDPRAGRGAVRAVGRRAAACCWAGRSTCCRSARTRPRRWACPVHATRLVLLGLAALVAGAATAVAGSVPFVGLMAPHALRPAGRTAEPPPAARGVPGRRAARGAGGPRHAHAQRALRAAARRAHRLRRRALLPAGAARQRGARMSERELLLSAHALAVRPRRRGACCRT